MAKVEQPATIAVNFHVPEGSSPAAASLFIQRTVDEIFEGSASHVHIGHQLSSEIMFSFQKPLVNSPELLEAFFKSLQRLFLRTKSYSPHFTQLPEISGNRN